MRAATPVRGHAANTRLNHDQLGNEPLLPAKRILRLLSSETRDQQHFAMHEVYLHRREALSPASTTPRGVLRSLTKPESSAVDVG